MTNTKYWVHNLDPFLIHFSGNFGIRFYGLAYVLGFLVGGWLLYLFCKQDKVVLSSEQQYLIITAMLLGVFVGGRMGYMLLYAVEDFIYRPWTIFQVWRGGMSSHGGFIGVALACWWASRKTKLSFFQLGDLLCPLVPPGLLFGRIANFINGELWGKVTTVPWAVIFPQSSLPGTPVELILPRHPSQIYEAGLEGALLLIYTQWRIWRTDVLNYPGRLSGEFLGLYAIVRIFGEQFRQPDAPLIFELSRGSFYSLFLLFFSIFLLMRSRKAG